MREQADARVLHLAGASNMRTQVYRDSMDDRTPASTSTSTGSPPAVQPENIHPTLLEYLQIIQRGGTDVGEPSDIYTTESSILSEKLNGLAPSGHNIEGTPISTLTPQGNSNVATTGPTAPSSQPLFYGGPSFETAQAPFAQVQSTDPPFDTPFTFNSIFQSPSLATQHPQLSGGISGLQRTSTVEPSLTHDNMSGSFRTDTVQMGDPNAVDGIDFARFMAENVPGLVYDGNAMGWDTFLAGWQTQL